MATLGALATAAGINAISNGIGKLGSILNATNSYGNSSGSGFGISKENNFSDMSSWESNMNTSMSNVYGTEASARDAIAADKANEAQYKFMQAQQAYNAAEAAKNRAYQTEMSNTSYQRAVVDLIKAGLNPILAAQNMGASTPAGAYATSGLQQAYKANTYADQESYGYGAGGGGSTSHSEGQGMSVNRNKSKSQNQSTTQGRDLVGTITSAAAGGAAGEALKTVLVGKNGTKIGKALANAYNNYTSGQKTAGGGGHKF